MPYPVAVSVEPRLTGRNRLTTAFRLILAIPHLILVGGVGVDFGACGRSSELPGIQGGILGVAATVLAVVSWFTLVFAGLQIDGIRQFTEYYLRWRLRALAYLMLLEDPYPPFGDGAYPTSLDIAGPAVPRNRWTVGFRFFLAIPHFIVLFFLQIAWTITTIVAWFLILFTGSYPEGIYTFGVGVLRWDLRVESYMYLLVDEYPPFSLV